MYRKLYLDLSRLGLMVSRGLSDSAIARVFGCSRETIFLRRRALGLASSVSRRTTRGGRTAIRHAREAEIDRLWERLALNEKVALLLQGDVVRQPVPQPLCQPTDQPIVRSPDHPIARRART